MVIDSPSMRRIANAFCLFIFVSSLVSCAPTNKVNLDGNAPTQAIVEESPTPLPAPTETPSPTPAPTETPSPTPTVAASPTLVLTSSEPSCLQTRGRIEQMFIPSEIVSDRLHYRIYLPGCYDALADRRFPVLYLLHGQGSYDDQWERLGVPAIMDQLIAANLASPFLVVMPYDPSQKESDEDPFGDTFPKEFIPWIDSHYRTLTDRQHRAIGGLSRGSGWAAHFGLSDWQEFGAIGMHSIAIFWKDVPSIKLWLDAIPDDQMPAFYIDIGDREDPKLLESASWFENLLTDQGIAHEWHLYYGYHDENYWEAHVEYYLMWYADQIGR